MSKSIGSLFSQGDGSRGKVERGRDNKRGGGNKTFNGNYWKGMEFYKCGEKSHLASHCTNVKKNKYDNDKSMKTNARRASAKILQRM